MTASKNSKPAFKVCTFDIETTGLDAVGSGVILCAVIKPLGEKPKVLRYDHMHLSPGKDRILTRAVINELAKYDMVVGHNIERFDLNFIKTRALVWDLPFLKKPYVYDTMKAFRRCGYLTVQNIVGKPSARLDMIVDMFGLKQRKTALYPRHHWQTVWGERGERKAAMDALVEHCTLDVAMNEDIYLRLFGADTGANLKRMK